MIPHRFYRLIVIVTASVVTVSAACYLFAESLKAHPYQRITIPELEDVHGNRAQLDSHGEIPDKVKAKLSMNSSDTATVRNSTLGFGKIVYISMPHRSDRQDGMALISSRVGLRFSYMPGVDGSTIHEKAKPLHSEGNREAEVGTWRAHANAWRHLLDSDMETMLILEDDVDFSYNLVDEMQMLSDHMRDNPLRLQPPTADEYQRAPYGLDWDVLFLGHCYFRMHDDWKKQRLEWPDEDSPTVDGRKFRSISPTFGITCTSAYAITREGARSLLYNVGYKELWQPVDLAMKTKFEEGRLKGYTVFPTMFSQWKIGHGKDSDTGNDQNVEQAKSANPDQPNSVRSLIDKEFPERNYWNDLKEAVDKGVLQRER